MQTAPFTYHRPTTVAEALDLLGEGARPLAGGHSLLPVMKLRQASPSALIDLSRIEELEGIDASGDEIVVGAMTTHADVASSPDIQQHCGIAAEAARMIGDVQVRNRGTIGGSVAHADPAADLPGVLQAVGASFAVTGSGGDRTIAADDFFVDLFATALADGELVTAVHLPKMAAGTVAVYEKHPHPASRYAVVGIAVVLSMDGGSVSDAAIVVGGVTATPARAMAAQDALTGQALTEDAIAAAAGHVASAITDPIGDLYASGEYRTHLAGVLTKRALTRAAALAGS